MTSSDIDKSQIRYARLAGFMYLFVDAAYLLGLYIVSGFQVTGNFAENAHRIMESELFSCIVVASLLMCGLCTVFLSMGLYGTVKLIDNNLALLALIFRLVEATLFGVLSILSFTALKLYIGADYRHAFDANQLSVLVNLHLVASFAGFNIAAIFFSVGSILFFYLFFKSTYIPKLLSGLVLFWSVLLTIV